MTKLAWTPWHKVVKIARTLGPASGRSTSSLPTSMTSQWARRIDEIAKLKNLTAGASGAGAIVHNLPKRPRDVEDEGEFRFVILGPQAASDATDLKVRLRLKLDGRGTSPDPDIVAKLNDLLSKISKKRCAQVGLHRMVSSMAFAL